MDLATFLIGGADVSRELAVPIGYRDLTTASGSGGDLVAGPLGVIAEALAATSVLGRAGATFLFGLDGNANLPSMATGATSEWLGEGGAPTRSTPVFAREVLSPTTLSAAVGFSRKLAIAGGAAVEEVVASDLTTSLGAELDAGGLGVSADGNAPDGLVAALAGTGSEIAFGAAVPTWSELLSMKRDVQAANAPDRLAWVLGPGMAETLGQTLAGDSGDFVFRQNEIADLPAFVTSAMPDDTLALGGWSDLVVGQFGDLDLRLDTTTLAASDGRIVRGFLDVDFAVRRASSFKIGRTPA